MRPLGLAEHERRHGGAAAHHSLEADRTGPGVGSSARFSRASAFPRFAAALTSHARWAGLAGEWTVGRERVVLEQAGGRIAYRFHARDAHLVLSPGARAPIPFRVLLDGEAPGASPGVDVDADGNGVLGDGHLFQLVREHDAVRKRTLEITFLEPGAEAYVFTFG